MNGLPSDLSPLQVMELRFKAQASEDFASIYHSSHRLSTLRRSFPSLKEYLEFAKESLSGQIVITDYQLLAEEILSRKSYVLCRVTMSHQGSTETFAEVAELRRSVVGWRFLHCSRLPLRLLPADPSTADIQKLLSHPEVVVY